MPEPRNHSLPMLAATAKAAGAPLQQDTKEDVQAARQTSIPAAEKVLDSSLTDSPGQGKPPGVHNVQLASVSGHSQVKLAEEEPSTSTQNRAHEKTVSNPAALAVKNGANLNDKTPSKVDGEKAVLPAQHGATPSSSSSSVAARSSKALADRAAERVQAAAARKAAALEKANKTNDTTSSVADNSSASRGTKEGGATVRPMAKAQAIEDGITAESNGTAAPSTEAVEMAAAVAPTTTTENVGAMGKIEHAIKKPAENEEVKTAPKGGGSVVQGKAGAMSMVPGKAESDVRELGWDICPEDRDAGSEIEAKQLVGKLANDVEVAVNKACDAGDTQAEARAVVVPMTTAAASTPPTGKARTVSVAHEASTTKEVKAETNAQKEMETTSAANTETKLGPSARSSIDVKSELIKSEAITSEVTQSEASVAESGSEAKVEETTQAKVEETKSAVAQPQVAVMNEERKSSIIASAQVCSYTCCT